MKPVNMKKCKFITVLVCQLEIVYNPIVVDIGVMLYLVNGFGTKFQI